MKQVTSNSDSEITMPTDLDEILSEKSGDDDARLRRIANLRLLWNHRRFISRVVAVGFLASLLLAFLIPKRYESTAQLMPPDGQSSSGLAMVAALSARVGGMGGVAGDLLGIKSTSAIFVGILHSRTVGDRLVQQFDLRKIYGAPRIENARAALEDHTTISDDRKSGIITIKVTDRDPQRATALAQAYVKELDRLVAELSTSAARRERVFLEERLKTVKDELDQASQKFSQFASKNTTIDIKEQGRAMVEAAATLSGQLIAAQAELEGLRQIYTDNNVRVRAIQARIAELKRQLNKLGGDAPGAPASPSNGEESMYPSIRKLPLLGVTYSDLFRRTKIDEVVFEMLTQQYELAKVQEAKEIPTVKVLDVPVVPERKSFPPRMFILFSGTVLSMGLAIVWVLSTARWHEMDPLAPEKILAQEVFMTLRAGAQEVSGNRFARRFLNLVRRRKESKQETAETESSTGGEDKTLLA